MEATKKEIIGIDLGTQNCCVAVWRNGRAEIIPDRNTGNRIIPSTVSFYDGMIKFGERAKEDKNMHPESVIHSIKRIIGRRFDDKEVQEDISKWQFKVEKNELSGAPKIVVDFKNKPQDYPIEKISGLLMEDLKRNAEIYLGHNIDSAVITVPAYFDSNQRQATIDAGRIAKLEVKEIISEPTSAALAYGIKNPQKKENILIFDFGSGTLDISILGVTDEIYDVIGTKGNSHLGGIDLDQKLFDYFTEKMGKEEKIFLDKTNPRQISRMMKACEDIKIMLSSRVEVEVLIDSLVQGKDILLKLNRSKFEQISKDIFDDCIKLVNDCLKESKTKNEDIEEVILIGGSSKIPKIKKMLSELFPRRKINDSINPDESVAIGAAIRGAKLSGANGEELEELQVCDVCPKHLGVASFAKPTDKVETLCPFILRNARLPCDVKHIFHTREENQTEFDIRVYQGNYRELSRDNLIGKFKISGVKKMKKGEAKLEITFHLNENGVLSVKGKELTNNKEESIVVEKYNLNLKEDEIILLMGEESDMTASCFTEFNNEFNQEKEQILDQEKMFQSTEDTNQKSQTAANICQSLQIQISKFINSKLDKNNMETFLALTQKFCIYLNYYNSLPNPDATVLDEFIHTLKIFIQKMHKEHSGYIFDFIDKFKEKSKTLYYSLLIYVIRLTFNEGLLIYDKGNKKDSKIIFQKAISIINSYQIKNRIRNPIVTKEDISDFKDVFESINFYINRADVSMLIEKADKILKDSVHEEEQLNMDGIYLALDYYRAAYNHIAESKDAQDLEYECICLSMISKIQFRILKINDIDSIGDKASCCVALAMSLGKNVETLGWYKEARAINEEIRKINEEIEDKDDIKFMDDYKAAHPDIFKRIEEESKKDNLSFIKFVLNTHPPKGYQTIEDIDNEFKTNTLKFCRKIRARYMPKALPKKSFEEKAHYTIMYTISCKLNVLLVDRPQISDAAEVTGTPDVFDDK